MFKDRREAGNLLALRLRQELPALPRRHQRRLVLAMPPGGLPVAHEVARVLRLPLSIAAAVHIGNSNDGRGPLAAVSAGGVLRIVAGAETTDGWSQLVGDLGATRAAVSKFRRSLLLRAGLPEYPMVTGKEVLLVAEGVANPLSVLAVIDELYSQHAARVIVAAPVMSVGCYDALAGACDQVLTILIEDDASDLHRYYQELEPVSEHDVIAALVDRQHHVLRVVS